MPLDNLYPCKSPSCGERRVLIIYPESKAISSCCQKCGAEHGRDGELMVVTIQLGGKNDFLSESYEPPISKEFQPLELADATLMGLREYKQTKNKRPQYRHDLNYLATILARVYNREGGTIEELTRERD